jgi:hypothetical protein
LLTATTTPHLTVMVPVSHETDAAEAAELDALIARVVARAPLPTPEQLDRIADLLRPAKPYGANGNDPDSGVRGDGDAA